MHSNVSGVGMLSWYDEIIKLPTLKLREIKEASKSVFLKFHQEL